MARRCWWRSARGSGCCWRRSATATSCASARTARRCWRCPAVDLTSTAVLGALLATDGYGNAQVAQVWEDVVSAELAGPITTRPLSWMANQLQAQAGQCASVDGSADDTTLALLVAPAAAHDGPAAPVPPAGG